MAQTRRIKVIPKKDYPAFIEIGCNAYPGMGVQGKEAKEKLRKRLTKACSDPTIEMYGLYEKGQLQGGLRLHDFNMNLFGTWVATGGGGFLAIDLLHKKEKMAKDLMTFFIDHFRDRGFPMVTLYPFRPDFYRKMGFGYGAKVDRYQILPADLPLGDSKKHVRYLTKKDFPAMTACYNRYAIKTHGMFKRCKYENMRLEMQNVQMIGFVKNRRLEGYMVFEFKSGGKDNFIFNNINVQEFIYENREAFSEIMTFLHTQADQVNRVIFSTQDEHFHFLPSDPRDGSNELTGPVAHSTNSQGIGIMYRVLDTPGLFKKLHNHSFGDANLKLKLTLEDSFLKENSGSYVIHFKNGRPQMKARSNHEVEIRLDVAEFSSLLLGAVNFGSLHEYGLAEISDTVYIPAINRLFGTDSRPISTTQF